MVTAESPVSRPPSHILPFHDRDITTLEQFIAEIDRGTSRAPMTSIPAATTADVDRSGARAARRAHERASSRVLSAALSALPKEDRPEAGRRFNAVASGDRSGARRRPGRRLAAAGGFQRLADPTMPAREHVARLAASRSRSCIDEIEAIFRELGFTVALGPEAEHEWYNFGALNFPADHPAMDLHDTLYLGEGRLLRTHTSPVQVRTLQAYAPPIRVLAPGNVYRRDFFDATHAPVFAQLEGPGDRRRHLVRRPQGDARRCSRAASTASSTRTRFGPSYFPFTEPSAQMDVEVDLGDGRGTALDGDPRLRPRASRRARSGGRRQRAVLRLGVRHGPGAHRHVALRHSRHPAALRFRRALPGAVRRMTDLARVAPRVRPARTRAPRQTARPRSRRTSRRSMRMERCAPTWRTSWSRASSRPAAPERGHLWVTKVDDGSGELLDVVCGAPNVTVGTLYPFARTGTDAARRPQAREAKDSRRDLERHAVLGARARARRRSRRHHGARHRRRARHAVPRRGAVGDVRFDIDVLPNRPDLLSHLGVAREVARADRRGTPACLTSCRTFRDCRCRSRGRHEREASSGRRDDPGRGRGRVPAVSWAS